MNIHAIGAAPVYRYANQPAAPQEPPSDQPPNAAPVAAPPDPTPPAAEAGGADGEPRTKGVLRLLMDGHFKGVADVRLRINFHDELSAVQQGAARASVGDQTAAVTEAVGAELANMAAAAGLDETGAAQAAELQAAFETAVAEAAEAFGAAESPSVGDLAGDIRVAFDALATGVESLLAPPAAEPDPLVEVQGVGEGDAPTDDGETEPAALGEEPVPAAPPSPLDGLREVFEAALQQLTDAMAPGSFLPELSPPNGNGAAYEKFLAIYRDLWAAPASDPAVATAPLDIEA